VQLLDQAVWVWRPVEATACLRRPRSTEEHGGRSQRRARSANRHNRTDADQAAFNQTPPTHQLARFGDHFVSAFRSFGYAEADARGLADGLLPDVLLYDSSDSAGYPNGRRLTDDILDLRVAMLTCGRVTTDLVGPHTDLLDEFPYLGAPHPARKP
jgi:hypothetical protein